MLRETTSHKIVSCLKQRANPVSLEIPMKNKGGGRSKNNNKTPQIMSQAVDEDLNMAAGQDLTTRDTVMED